MSKAGFVALVGRPNAGKSTLMNWLLGEKIALVSQTANATRRRSNAIVMHHDDQIIFVDTPGLHEKEKLLNQYMLEEALKAIGIVIWSSTLLLRLTVLNIIRNSSNFTMMTKNISLFSVKLIRFPRKNFLNALLNTTSFQIILKP